MSSVLRVNPQVLVASAHEEEALATELAALKPGQPVSEAAGAVAGLQSAAACTECGTVLETAANLLSTDLSQFGTKLGTAAGQYEQTDAAAAEVLAKFAGPVRYEVV